MHWGIHDSIQHFGLYLIVVGLEESHKGILEFIQQFGLYLAVSELKMCNIGASVPSLGTAWKHAKPGCIENAGRK